MHVPSLRIGVVCTAAALVLGTTDVGSAASAPVRAPAAGATIAGASAPSQFAAVGPVRLADTREAICNCTRLDAHTIRVIIAGRAGIGAGISAAAVTITATAGPTAGFVSAFPSGQPLPDTSTLNVPVGADTSNSTIIPVGAGGSIDLYASIDTQLIVDVTGTFTPAATAAGGRFVPTAPTRLLDTRASSPTGIDRGGRVTVALPSGVDPTARAVVVNVTSVDARDPGFLTGYAAGAPAPNTSFMNPDGTGAAKAASIILPASPLGFTIASSVGGHVIVDLVGWFTGDSAPTSSDGLLVAVTPTRLLDTRSDVPRVWSGGTREIDLPVAVAGALVTNVTVVSPDAAGFVTAYPAGTAFPPTSSVNAAARNATAPNLAITTASTRGTAYFSSNGTDLIVDLTGYFTGTPLAATQPVPPNVAAVPRVLMVGDSTLGGFAFVTSALSALRGFTPTLDVQPCRRLISPSCTSAFTNYAPNTALDAVRSASGSFDIVVIKTGYNDSATIIETAVGQILSAARAKGATAVIWLTYSESRRPGAYDTSNATLKRLAGSAAYPDLVVADWRTFAARSVGWYASDRVHLNTIGVWATADYITRLVANVSHLPCQVPWTAGAALDNPCPNPDAYLAAAGSTPNLHALYGI